ncbi:MAG: alpha-galactosidase [Eubacteriales bacterium]|nr:alpha-galactosidase [Eubacteriales bacterium]
MNCKYELIYSVNGTEKTLTAPSNVDVKLAFSDEDGRRRVVLTALTDVELNSYNETEHDFFTKPEPVDPDPKGDLYFINGYQSWTETREFYADARERNVTSLPKALVKNFSLDRYGDATFYEYDKRILHGYDYFYVKGTTGAFICNLNARNAYLIVEVVRRIGAVTLISDVRGKHLKAGETYTICDYMYRGTYEEGLAEFDRLFPKKDVEKVFGYTSWYNYYQNINETIILRDLDALDERFNLFQIDDGYETFVGDWLDVDARKFPSGLASVVEKIHAKGYKAGIWLAPFVAEEKSRLYNEKRGWFRKGRDGECVKCESNWSGFYALDLENEEAREYIRRCLLHYADMGFDFFKLDFLYAANLPDYEGKTRSEAAEEAYSFLREALGEKKILGCGATLSNSAGKFDYLRVGPDVSLKFDDAWFMRFMHRERISTKVTLQNTIYRSFMDGRLFGCDPDVFLLRDDNISLTSDQRRALVTVNALFGSMLMTSDNIAGYDEEKKARLSDALDLFRSARVVSFSRRADVVTICYEAKGREYTIRYDTEKGVLV